MSTSAQDLKAELLRVLTEFFGNDIRRINHAKSVLHHAELLAKDRSDADMDILLACAILHDVGIKPSEEKYGYNNGKTQEELGPAEAEKLLHSINFPVNKVQKVKDIIGNHHSRSHYDYPELEILKSADLIVNRTGS